MGVGPGHTGAVLPHAGNQCAGGLQMCKWIQQKPLRGPYHVNGPGAAASTIQVGHNFPSKRVPRGEDPGAEKGRLAVGQEGKHETGKESIWVFREGKKK